MKKKNKKEFGKLVVFSLLVILLTMSAAQAINYQSEESPPMGPLYEDFYFVWEDEFDNYEYIDSDYSYNHVVSDGIAYMDHTYSFWTDPNWDYMKPIKLDNSGSALDDYAVHLTVEKEEEMQDDYDDLRFKHEDEPNVWCDYWIEESDDSSANVYVKTDIPSGESMLYMFYGHETCSGMSDWYNVFEWEEDEPNDFDITSNQPPVRSEDPDIAYGSANNGRFLVTWEHGQKASLIHKWKRGIEGEIYKPNGDVAVSTFTIRTGSGTQWRHENPQAAYGGGNYLVTWQHFYTSTDEQSSNIIARFVSPSGSLGTQWVVCEEDYCQANPEIVFNSEDEYFFIVWEDARETYYNYNLYGKLYDTSGNQVGSEKEICTDSGNQCEPWVAYNSIDNQYMIVWEEGATANSGPFSIYVGLFDDDLDCIGPGSNNQPLEIATGTDDIDYNFPCVCFNEESELYLVTWNDGDISDGDWRGNVWGRIFDSSGNTVKSNWKIKSGNFVRTDIVNYLDTCWLVSFDGNLKIWGKFVDQDGTVYADEIQLSASSAAEADWASMAAHDGRIFVAWEDERSVWPTMNDLEDIYANFWQLNTPTGDDVEVTWESEIGIVLEARITSEILEFANLEAWMDFWESHNLNGGTLTFDILDEDATTVLIGGISNGGSLHSLNPDHTAIRLRANFERNNPSQTPELKNYSVRYLGVDDDPPITHIDYIVGEQGTPPWYIDDTIQVFLIAEDMPPEYHSGVDYTLFTVDGGSPQTYNEDTGIVLDVPDPELWHIWDLEYWSVDKKGNVETPPKEKTIKTDFQDPDVYITKPSKGQHVRVPFWVEADAVDNYNVKNVTFNLAPFGERPGLPYVDTDGSDGWKWYCEEEDAMGQSVGHIFVEVYDESGRTDYHDIEIYVENWEITIENTKCLVFAQGTGSTSNSFPLVFFKDIEWHYEGGYCATLGQEGPASIDLDHWGTATKFVGLATNNRIVGYAQYLYASNLQPPYLLK